MSQFKFYPNRTRLRKIMAGWSAGKIAALWREVTLAEDLGLMSTEDADLLFDLMEEFI